MRHLSLVAGAAAESDSYERIKSLVRARDAAALRRATGLPEDIPDDQVIDATEWLLTGMEAFARHDRDRASEAFDRADPVISRASDEVVRDNFQFARRFIDADELFADEHYREAETAFNSLVDDLGKLAVRFDDAEPIRITAAASLTITRLNAALKEGRITEVNELAARAAEALEAQGEDKDDAARARYRSEALTLKVEVASTLADIAIHEFDFDRAKSRLRAGANEAKELTEAPAKTPQMELALARREAIASVIDLATLLEQSHAPDAKTLNKNVDEASTKLDALAALADEGVETNLNIEDEVARLGRATEFIAASGRSASAAAQPQLPFGARGSGVILALLGAAVLIGGVVAAIKLGGWSGVIVGAIVVVAGSMLAILAAWGLRAGKAVPLIKAFSGLLDSAAKVGEAAAKIKAGSTQTTGAETATGETRGAETPHGESARGEAPRGEPGPVQPGGDQPAGLRPGPDAPRPDDT